MQLCYETLNPKPYVQVWYETLNLNPKPYVKVWYETLNAKR